MNSGVIEASWDDVVGILLGNMGEAQSSQKAFCRTRRLLDPVCVIMTKKVRQIDKLLFRDKERCCQRCTVDQERSDGGTH